VRIDRVEVFLLDFPLPRRRIFSTGGNDSRGALLVRLEDEAGVSGWGETYPFPAGVTLLAEAGERLVGRDPDNALENWGLVWAASGGNGFATGALSMALDDLRARRHGVSVSTLCGGPRRSRVRAYASSEGYVIGIPAADAWVAEAERAVEAGFAGFKLRIGGQPIASDLAAARIVREAHPTLELMADGNGAYTPREAREVGAALAGLGFRWLEEPTPTAQYAGYERLRGALPLTLAGGESVQGRAEAIALVDRGCFDVIQPDVSICGGIGEALAIASAARLAAIETCPHACNGALGLAATLQLLAVLPDPTRLSADAPWLEHDFGPNPARTELLTEPIAAAGGWVAIPTGPGLGVEVDEGFVRRESVATAAAQRTVPL
jgi:D-galactarolactone cycloisomerase